MSKKNQFDSPMQSAFPVKKASVKTPMTCAPVGEKYVGDVNKTTAPIDSPMSGMATPTSRKK